MLENYIRRQILKQADPKIWVIENNYDKTETPKYPNIEIPKKRPKGKMKVMKSGWRNTIDLNTRSVLVTNKYMFVL